MILPDPTFKIWTQNLSAPSFDGVLRGLDAYLRYLQDEREALVVDLSDVGFVDPYAVGMLCLIGRYLRERFDRVTYRLPDAEAVKGYLARMKFLRALEDHVEFEGRDWSMEYAEGTVGEGLLEVTAIRRREDVESLIGTISRTVSSILTAELGYTVREITSFQNVVAELSHNILDHSGDRGYVVAQRYTDRRGRKFAVIGVVDLGMGIRESLASRFDVSDWTHAQAIAQALRKNVSRDPERGIGLYVVSTICSEYEGTLHIRSGDARVYVKGARVHANVSPVFPGTQIGLTLYEKRG